MMRRHNSHSRVRNAISYLIVLFLFLPGVILVLGLFSRMPSGLLGGWLSLYYIVAFVVVVVGGLNWIARALE